MATKETIVVKRDKARRYAKLSAEYASWTPLVKRLVANADDEEWGTYVVAHALLESVIPRVEIDKVERQIEYDKQYEEYRESAEKRDYSCRYACIAVSAISTLLTYVLLCMIASNHMLNYIDVSRFSAAFSAPGLIAFSFIGSVSTGFALGSNTNRFKRLPNSPIFFSSMVGIACAFFTPLMPPFALIAAWVAWRSSGAMRPQTIDMLQKQAEYREIHGRRVYARNPKAPWFVKNAIRLAGIYRNSTGSIGVIAHEALARSQSDYGAFIVYEAVLAEHHAQRRAAESIQQVEKRASDENNGEASTITTSDELRAAASTDEQAERSGIVKRSIVVSAAVAIAMWCMANTSAMFVALSDPIRTYALGTSLVVFCLVGILIGWRSGARVATMYGLGSEGKRQASVLRSAWFTAWAMLVGVYLIFLLSVG